MKHGNRLDKFFRLKMKKNVKKSILALSVALIGFGGVGLFYPSNHHVVQATQARCVPSEGPQVLRVTTNTVMRGGAPGTSAHSVQVMSLVTNNNVTHRSGTSLINNWRGVARNGTNGWVNNSHLAAVTC